jgi:putative peptide zinc metalloprotease protein
MRLGSQELEAEAAVLKARIAALEAERSAAWGREPVRVRQAQEALQRDIATLQDLTQRLTVKAPQAGLVVLQGGGDGLGSDIQQGDLLAHVLPTGGARVLAVIPEDDVGLWREALRASGGQGVRPEVMVSDERGEVRQARLVRQAPAALERLPTVALGATPGGPVQTDPADPDGLKPLRPVFVIELDVPDRGLARVGARAQVKLSLPAQSLADQLVFRFRQLLLRQFAQLA